ncbi:DUF5677 domain-containing protein [Candidatus Palauibacter sp.]|uniref:DUF5677 domain-containing protein n=1 Tax=Candidatus Palauibacter sp. TaxID=3101350 RepID=UPI003B01AF52
MPDSASQSFKPLLDRELNVRTVSQLDDVAFRPLREVVNHATRAFTRCWHNAPSSKEDTDVPLAPFALYRQSIQLADGIEVALSHSCVEAAIPMLRSLFETGLGLAYILEQKSTFRARALACLCGDTFRRLDYWETVRSDEVTPDFAAQVEQEFIDEQLVPQIETLRAALGKPHMKEVVEAYEERQKRRQYPPWYSLVDEDLTSLRKLAERLGSTDMYLLGYSRWSGVVHGTTVAEPFSLLDDGRVSVSPLRHAEQLCSIAARALDFLASATVDMLGWFRPAEELQTAAWLESEVVPALDRLQETRVKINPTMKHDW